LFLLPRFGENMSIAQIKNYAYANARIRAMKSNLLSKADLERACRLEDLSSFMGFLEEHSYPELFDIKKHTQKVVEHALHTHLVNNSNKIYSLTHDRAKPFMGARTNRNEINAIKGIINSKPQNREPFKVLLSRKMANGFSRVKDANDMEKLVTGFKGTKYEKILESVSEDYAKTNNIFLYSIMLDKHHFSLLYETMNLLDSSDKSKARDIIGLEVDTLNISTVFRTLGMENSADYIIPHYHKLRRQLIDECLRCKDVADVVSKMSDTQYGELLGNGLSVYEKTGSVFIFERVLKENLLLANRMLLVKNIFNIGVLLAFLNIKEAEILNLRRIAVGLNHKLPAEEIKDLVVY